MPTVCANVRAQHALEWKHLCDQNMHSSRSGRTCPDRLGFVLVPVGGKRRLREACSVSKCNSAMESAVQQRLA